MSGQERTGAPAHLSADEFRALGHRAVDWIADYLAGVESRPVLSRLKPGDVLRALPEHAPVEGLGAQGWDRIFADLDTVIVPGLTHWQSPNFFAFFPGNATGPGILGELLSAGMGVNGMLWATSPAATELETRVMDWMGEMLGLPAPFLSRGGVGGGVIQGTASESTLIAMLAARRRVAADADKGPLVAYASTQAHSSVIKGAMIAGVARGPDDREGVRLIDTDSSYAMRPDLLERAIRDDLAAGKRPFYVCATVGTTSSTAVDPIVAIADVLDRALGQRGAWLHVDAAHSGAACICPEHRGMLDGIDRADSLCFNPHKWLLTNFDCDCFWTRDKASLIGALSITPEYLRNAASDAGAVIDYRDWQVALGRRFRALKLWLVIRHYGVEGLRAHIREHVRLAALFESWVRESHRFEVVAPRTVNLVCFRLRGEAPAADAKNKRLLETINASGKAYLTHTVLRGPGGDDRVVLRMCIGATMTAERHVKGAWDLIRHLADSV